MLRNMWNALTPRITIQRPREGAQGQEIVDIQLDSAPLILLRFLLFELVFFREGYFYFSILLSSSSCGIIVEAPQEWQTKKKWAWISTFFSIPLLFTGLGAILGKLSTQVLTGNLYGLEVFFLAALSIIFFYFSSNAFYWQSLMSLNQEFVGW